MDSKREAVQDGPALLRQERAQASFPLRDMTHFLDGGPQRTAKKEALRAIALQDPLFSLESNQNKAFLSREERYRNGLRLVNRVQALRLKHGWTHEERVLFEEEACTESLPTGLNDVAFVPFVRSQGTEEQIQKWAVPAENYEIIGSYSQTELGHGSNVQGLQTTALYLPDSDEFELNTDSITATKWWPGAIAHTATHTVLMARLLIPDRENKNKIKDYGVHGFVVQLRCLETHQPLPGITLGDIGPKMGSPAVDNGFMRLQGVRIPRTNMLMRHAQVEKGTGAYSKPPHSKIAYLGMVYIRVKLVLSAASALARGVTVATRYSAVRRQFGPEPGAPEKQLLDYKLQQYRILPHVARTYALIFTGRYMQNLFDTLSSHLASYSSSSASSSSDPFATLPLVHATSSGLKSWCTFMAAEGLESCRRTLGGHGYAHYSGISEITAGYVGILAAEGENYLLTQQTARYLLKLFEKTKREKRVPEEASMADYLEKCREEGILEREKCTATTLQELLLPETLVMMLLSYCFHLFSSN
ncbi:Acyl-coenzyme A oxidase (Acyl-CoA oxidase) [Balamuthia mandrillaris]